MPRATGTLTRANVIKGAACAVAAIAGARAPVLGASMSVPTVDRVKIRVVIDNTHEFLPNSTVNGVVAERTNPDFGSARTAKLEGQFGYSLLLESTAGANKRRYLLDFGLTGDALMNNLAVLGIFAGELDGLILSHGHIDHFAGLVPFLRATRQEMRPDLSLYAGGEDNFCYQHLRKPDGQFVDAGVVDRRDLAASKVNVVLAEQPIVIGDQAFTTGIIPLTGFEKIFPNTWTEIGVRDGAGCSSDHFTAAERQGKIVPSVHHNEHATCYNVKDRGLVVISSCGHVGILNTVKRAQQVAGISKVHAVVGGFHLFPASPDYVSQVVSELKTISPDAVIPMHCSGAGFTAAMRSLMPDRLIVSSLGSTYTFGA